MYKKGIPCNKLIPSSTTTKLHISSGEKWTMLCGAKFSNNPIGDNTYQFAHYAICKNCTKKWEKIK